jgi:hypothetical protein
VTARQPAVTLPEGNRLQSTAIGMARLEVAPPRRGAHDSLSSRSKPLRSLRQTLCVLCVFILRFPCAFLALGGAEIFSNRWKTGEKFFQSLEKSGRIFQPLEKIFPIIGKFGGSFPTIGKFFPIIGKFGGGRGEIRLQSKGERNLTPET